MKITLNAIQYKNNSSGIGLLIYNLYNALFEEIEKRDTEVEIDLITSKNSPDMLQKSYGFVNKKEIPYTKDQNIKRNLYELLKLGNSIDKKSHIYFSVDSKLPLFFSNKTKKVLTITDMAVYRMGDVYQASRTAYWRLLFKHSVNVADKVIAISTFTKDEIVDILGTDADKIEVIYCGVNDNFGRIEDKDMLKAVKSKYSLNEPFILFVGTFSPRKNLYGLIRAFELLKTKYSLPHKLVIVGEKGWKFDKEARLLRESKIAESIVFPGYIPDEDLPAIYNIAELTVYPSLYEGFGLPVIESMACGTPVALSNTSCLPEVAGDAGLYFDPYNIDEMASRIFKALTDENMRRSLIEKGIDRAKKYSWSQAAKELIKVFEEFL